MKSSQLAGPLCYPSFFVHVWLKKSLWQERLVDFKHTHIQGDVNASKEVIGILLGAWWRGSVGTHWLRYLLKIPDSKKHIVGKREALSQTECMPSWSVTVIIYPYSSLMLLSSVTMTALAVLLSNEVQLLLQKGFKCFFPSIMIGILRFSLDIQQLLIILSLAPRVL